jgi:glycine cleavage system H protein
MYRERRGENKMVPIVIAGIILAFLSIDVIIQTVQHRRGKQVHGFFIPDPIEEAVPLNFGRMLDCLRGFGIAPAHNVFVHSGHTWAGIEQSGEAVVGLDSFVKRAIGKVDEVEFPQVGQKVRQGEKLLVVHQGNRVAEFVAPIDGVISAVREIPAHLSDLRSSDWICRIKPNNLAANLKVLRIAEDAVKWMYEELFRLQELVAMQIPRLQTVGVTMQDGALALDNLLETLDDDAWNQFQTRFLKS